MLLNELMKGYLKDLSLNKEFEKPVDPIWTLLTLWDDCVLLVRNLKNVKLPNKFSETYFYDRTSLEADMNHVHLNTIFNQDVKPIIVLEFGLGLMKNWERKLKSDYPERKFHLILSFDGTETVLRFYTLRDNEPSWINVESLENYKEEGILVKLI